MSKKQFRRRRERVDKSVEFVYYFTITHLPAPYSFHDASRIIRLLHEYIQQPYKSSRVQTSKGSSNHVPRTDPQRDAKEYLDPFTLLTYLARATCCWVGATILLVTAGIDHADAATGFQHLRREGRSNR
jgi:hypothetical protein